MYESTCAMICTASADPSGGNDHPAIVFLERRVPCSTSYQALWLQADSASNDDVMGDCLFVCSPPTHGTDTDAVLAWAQAWINGRTSFYITRALIGACEGGFIPGTILFTTYFYKSRELSVRLAAFWSTLNVRSFPGFVIPCEASCLHVQVARVISSLLAAGILQMRGVHGKSGWFWLFLLEGLLTFAIGLAVRAALFVFRA